MCRKLVTKLVLHRLDVCQGGGKPRRLAPQHRQKWHCSWEQQLRAAHLLVQAAQLAQTCNNLGNSRRRLVPARGQVVQLAHLHSAIVCLWGMLYGRAMKRVERVKGSDLPGTNPAPSKRRLALRGTPQSDGQCRTTHSGRGARTSHRPLPAYLAERVADAAQADLQVR